MKSETLTIFEEQNKNDNEEENDDIEDIEEIMMHSFWAVSRSVFSESVEMTYTMKSDGKLV